ncbi:cell adhesion molecule 3-like [Penaeus japonicus]|uniref:cell adhesion molecule 3-like n=1 Tax=Penaeus japonicus TaxID=27405 RepID=UPI001C7169F3|nr:cell adhesion molecule 3-like [Penaeus japonicus]
MEAPACLLLTILPVCWAGTDYQEANYATWVQVRKFVVPQYVALGENVSLHCDYEVQDHAKLYSLKWYKGNSQFYQYIPSKQTPHAAFSVQGIRMEQVVHEHEGRLVILKGVEVGATDVYRCEMVAEGPPFHTLQRSANMTVVVVPDGPPVITGSQEYYHLHDLVTLNCTAPLAQPGVTLTWFLNDKEALPESVRLVDRETNPAGLERITTRLSLHVTQNHFQNAAMTIKCMASLANLYLQSAQVIIREPSNTWLVSSNLYHTSGAEMPRSNHLLTSLYSVVLLIVLLLRM